MSEKCDPEHYSVGAVSYTHLTGEQEKMIRSVQQQIEECVPDLDERIRQQEEALEQATPVSYTHLDVYKRQA